MHLICTFTFQSGAAATADGAGAAILAAGVGAGRTCGFFQSGTAADPAAERAGGAGAWAAVAGGLAAAGLLLPGASP